MKIQIYEHSTPQEAVQSLAAGVDFIGVVTGEAARLPWEVDYDGCREIFATISEAQRARSASRAMAVALTVSPDIGEISEMVRAVEPDVLHLSGTLNEHPLEQLREIRSRFPQLKIMQAIGVNGPESVELACGYQYLCDYFLLDTDLADFPAVGATGATHDWRFSAQIVQSVHIPVILAGGLSPENVAQAIQAVKPWGVDSCSHTNFPNSRRKDPAKIADFVQAARACGL